MTEEISKKLNGEKWITLLHVMNNFDETNNFFMNNIGKIGIFVKLIEEVSMRWKNWSDVKALHSINFQEENWSKIEELQNEVNCVNDSRYFKDAETVRSGQSHVSSQTSVFPTFEILAECWAVLWECPAATKGWQVFRAHMVYRETFLQIQRRLLQHVIRKS